MAWVILVIGSAAVRKFLAANGIVPSYIHVEGGSRRLEFMFEEREQALKLHRKLKRSGLKSSMFRTV